MITTEDIKDFEKSLFKNNNLNKYLLIFFILYLFYLIITFILI